MSEGYSKPPMLDASSHRGNNDNGESQSNKDTLEMATFSRHPQNFYMSLPGGGARTQMLLGEAIKGDKLFDDDSIALIRKFDAIDRAIVALKKDIVQIRNRNRDILALTQIINGSSPQEEKDIAYKAWCRKIDNLQREMSDVIALLLQEGFTEDELFS